MLVTLLGDVATNYVTYRTTEQRIEYAKENVALQHKTLKIVEGQRKVGIVGELDVDEARVPWSKPRRPSRSWKLPSARPQINSASCWAFRPKTCKAGSVRGRFPPRRRKWPSASRQTCSAAGPTSAAPNGRPPPRRPNRHCRGPILSLHLDQRHDRLLRPELRGLFQEKALTGRVGPLQLEHPQLWPALEQ